MKISSFAATLSLFVTVEHMHHNNVQIKLKVWSVYTV